MATSALLVEIVVMGVLTLIALIADLCNLNWKAACGLLDWYHQLRLGTATGAAVIFGLAYPIGWALNSLAYIFTAAVFRAMETDGGQAVKAAQAGEVQTAEDDKKPDVPFSYRKVPKEFVKEFRKRLTEVETGDDGTFIGYLGNYNSAHGRTMQNASDLSARLIMEHLSMLRIDRSSFLVSLLFLPASFPPLNNFLWWLTLPINIVAILVLYRLTAKAYIYYRLLRDAVLKVIDEDRAWEREQIRKP